MIASVFFMQPLGQISGNIVSLLVIVGTRNTQGYTDLTRSVDIMWRWIIGIGVIPGVVALAFRIAIPETPRFLLDIEDDPIKAEFDTTQLFGEIETISPVVELGDRSESYPTSVDVRPNGNHGFDFDFDGNTARAAAAAAPSNSSSYNSSDITLSGAPNPTLNSKWTLSRADIHRYFWIEGNWRTLTATSLCWLFLDFGFYGINISNPQFLAKTWGTLNLSKGSHPIWMTNDAPDANLYDSFMDTSIQALVILNIGSFTGGLALILFANRLNRVTLQKYGFLFLAALFIALGTTFVTTRRTGAFAIALYVVGQFAFNFGPNATTYILPAELFPTRYRASCHGISAATGKLGALLVQIFSAYYKFGSSSPGGGQTRRYGIILIVFSVAMMLGSLLTFWGIPDVQQRKSLFSYRNKSLEELAVGRGHNREATTNEVRNRYRLRPWSLPRWRRGARQR